MKRRVFPGSAAGTAAVVTGLNGCTGGNKDRFKHLKGIKQYRMTIVKSAEKHCRNSVSATAVISLRITSRFFTCIKYVADHEYGGFMCDTDRDGTNLTTN